MSAEDFLEGKVILVDKPLDWTSFQVVNKIRHKIRHQFSIKKIKVGHAGTLDPKATGLLILCTGKKTKDISEIQDAPKVYEAKIKLGYTTASYDTESEEVFSADVSHLTQENIASVLESFIGESLQRPPIFSAIKIDGKRAYDMARKGEEVEMKLRPIQITALHILNFSNGILEVEVHCSKGTYIRSLAHDIGEKLGVGGYLLGLRRTRIGAYDVVDASSQYIEDDFQF